MKKLIIFLIIPLLFTTINLKKDDMIRIRIIANSNSEKDQAIKMNLSNKVKKELYSLLKEETNIDKARDIIKTNLDKIEEIVKNENLEYSYNINYGMNFFPEKTYNGKFYKEGNYESLVITLGEGLGNNWWCILFPPLCLVEAEEKETKNVEYNFLLKDIFDKIF